MTCATSDVIIGETAVKRHMPNGYWPTERSGYSLVDLFIEAL